MIFIEDDIHCEQSDPFATFEEAIAELRRRAAVPWDQPPNRAPCASWQTCGREYHVHEYDAPQSTLLRSVHVLDISAKATEWLPGFEATWAAKDNVLPPAGLLIDDAIELRLLRVMGPATAASRPATEQFFSHVPEYRFAIHRQSDGLRVGRIHLRVTNDETITLTIGHAGYAIDEPHRRNGYATRAIRLMAGLARHWGISPLWVMIEPENIPSRRAVERAGFTLAYVIDSPAEIVSLGTGPRVCRYRYEVA